jgi:phosphoribosylanthranilate isomerase
LKRHGIEPVLVVVNESIETILSLVNSYGFTTVQLHGSEPSETCRLLRQQGLTLIKAFAIASEKDFKETTYYADCCDFFLFDTRTLLPGGSGNSFDWNCLNAYKGPVRFFLSGGIQPDDSDRILALQHPFLYAVDLNSRFEATPGIKDPTLLADFIARLRLESQHP